MTNETDKDCDAGLETVKPMQQSEDRIHRASNTTCVSVTLGIPNEKQVGFTLRHKAKLTEALFDMPEELKKLIRFIFLKGSDALKTKDQGS